MNWRTGGRRLGAMLAWLVVWTAAPNPATAYTKPEFDAVGREFIPRQVVKTLAQDRQGFLWVATGDGLVRFDGYRFQPIERQHADPARRNLGWVRAMLAARDGRVWISSESDGLVSYDPVTDRIHDHADPERAAPPAPTLALAEDVDGAIWSGTLGRGLEYHAPPHGAGQRSVTRFAHRADEPGSLPDDRIEALHVDLAGTLWVGGWQGLSRRLAGSQRFEPVPEKSAAGAELTGRRVLTLLASANQQLWVGTQQGDLVTLDPKTGTARWLAAPAGGRGATTALAESDDGRIWVGTERGIEVWDATGATRLHLLRHDAQQPDGLAANQVTTLLKDRAGAIWVGGLGIGLQRHNPAAAGISVRRAEPGANFDGNVHGLLALGNGQVWAATSSTPLVILDEQLRPQRELRLPPGDNGVDTITRVHAMALGANGHAWLAAGDWLLELDVRGNLLSRRRHGIGEVVRLLGAADGGLWLAGHDGLHRLGPRAASHTAPTRIRLAAGESHFSSAINTLALAPDGALWVGAASGLFRLPPGRLDGLEPVTSPQGAGLGNSVVGGLLFSRDGRLWVDTAVTGLHRSTALAGNQASFDRVSLRHGIHNRPFGLNLLEDQRGRIWTQQYVYDPGTDHLLELTAADGKDFGMGWFFSYTKTRDGRFLFGGTHGVLVIEPERFDASNYMPPLAVTSLRVDGQRASTAGLPGQLALGPEHHGLAIEFAALDFSDPQRIRYAYQLEGVDADWITTDADFRVASYGNLAPGEYTLRIKASNRNGVWNPDPLAIGLSVAPAWWQRWEVRMLALAGLLLAMLAYFRWRTRRLRQRQRELETRVRERTLELVAVTRALETKSDQLEQASLTDPLSGLHNRRYLQQHIDADAARALLLSEQSEHGTPQVNADLVFFLVDIDHFKLVNDDLGHPAGDAVIRQIPQRLRAVFRGSDHLVRWGGEEFLIVVREGSREFAAELAERARAAVAGEPFVLDDGQPLHCTCSVGFACFPLDPRLPEALAWHEVVSVADAALLQAKQEGRNRWVGVVDADATQRPTHQSGWLRDGVATVRRS